jgi:hypothetical protein
MLGSCWIYVYLSARGGDILVFVLSLCEIDARVDIPPVVSQWTLRQATNLEVIEFCMDAMCLCCPSRVVPTVILVARGCDYAISLAGVTI